eukprot:69729-Hanusia_phi.AAC.4
MGKEIVSAVDLPQIFQHLRDASMRFLLHLDPLPEEDRNLEKSGKFSAQENQTDGPNEIPVNEDLNKPCSTSDIADSQIKAVESNAEMNTSLRFATDKSERVMSGAEPIEEVMDLENMETSSKTQAQTQEPVASLVPPEGKSGGAGGEGGTESEAGDQTDSETELEDDEKEDEVEHANQDAAFATDSEDEETHEVARELMCKQGCKRDRKWDSRSFMLCCDTCNVWFHGDCIGVKAGNITEEDNWVCSADCADDLPLKDRRGNVIIGSHVPRRRKAANAVKKSSENKSKEQRSKSMKKDGCPIARGLKALPEECLDLGKLVGRDMMYFWDDLSKWFQCRIKDVPHIGTGESVVAIAAFRSKDTKGCLSGEKELVLKKDEYGNSSNKKWFLLANKSNKDESSGVSTNEIHCKKSCKVGRSVVENVFMLFCEACEVWFHGSCVGLQEGDIQDENAIWVCCQSCKFDLPQDVQPDALVGCWFKDAKKNEPPKKVIIPKFKKSLSSRISSSFRKKPVENDSDDDVPILQNLQPNETDEGQEARDHTPEEPLESPTAELQQEAVEGLMYLSKPLADFIGRDRMSRKDAMAFVLDYIKLHDLFDPEDYGYILPDDRIRAMLGGKERIKLPKLARKVSKMIVISLEDPESQSSASKRSREDVVEEIADSQKRPKSGQLPGVDDGNSNEDHLTVQSDGRDEEEPPDQSDNIPCSSMDSEEQNLRSEDAKEQGSSLVEDDSASSPVRNYPSRAKLALDDTDDEGDLEDSAHGETSHPNPIEDQEIVENQGETIGATENKKDGQNLDEEGMGENGMAQHDVAQDVESQEMSTSITETFDTDEEGEALFNDNLHSPVDTDTEAETCKDCSDSHRGDERADATPDVKEWGEAKESTATTAGPEVGAAAESPNNELSETKREETLQEEEYSTSKEAAVVQHTHVREVSIVKRNLEDGAVVNEQTTRKKVRVEETPSAAPVISLDLEDEDDEDELDAEELKRLEASALAKLQQGDKVSYASKTQEVKETPAKAPSAQWMQASLIEDDDEIDASDLALLEQEAIRNLQYCS